MEILRHFTWKSLNNTFTIYKYELKKILRHKIVWVMMFGMVFLILLSVGADIFFNGKTINSKWMSMYEYTMKKQVAAEKLEGRVFDEILYQEMKNAYAEDMESGEYLAYEDVYDLLRAVIGGGEIMLSDMDAFYKRRWEKIETNFTNIRLSEKEKAYWYSKNSEISIPITYNRAQAPYEILEAVYTLGVLMLLVIAAGLPGVFCDEHRMRTDQLTLCSRYGRGRLYFAKIAAGLTFCLMSAFILAAVTVVPVLIVYGTEGFEAAILIKMVYAISNKSIGEILAGYFLIYFLASLLLGAFAMFFSELTHNGIATMTVMVCGMLFCLTVNIPDNLRLPAQITALLPNCILAPWSLYEYRLIPFFGGYLTNIQAAPLIYLFFTVLFIILGRRLYNGYQAGGR